MTKHPAAIKARAVLTSPHTVAWTAPVVGLLQSFGQFPIEFGHQDINLSDHWALLAWAAALVSTVLRRK